MSQQMYAPKWGWPKRVNDFLDDQKNPVTTQQIYKGLEKKGFLVTKKDKHEIRRSLDQLKQKKLAKRVIVPGRIKGSWVAISQIGGGQEA